VPKNRLNLSISCLILLHKHVYFLDLILLWPVTYFKDIKAKSYGIGSQTKLLHQPMDHKTNRSHLLYQHRAYDSYAHVYGPYGLYPEKFLKGSDLMPRFPSNLADPSPVNTPNNLRLGELHFGHHFHASFTSSTLSSQTLATGQSQGRSETSEALSPERRQGSKHNNSTGQQLEFDYLFLLYSLLFR
jgi:hypothetical protein